MGINKATQIISKIRDTFGRYPDNSGGCFKFHLLLKELFPNAEGWYNSNHILTEIDGKYYDIDGEQELKDNYLPIELFGYDNIFNSFKDKINIDLWKIKN